MQTRHRTLLSTICLIGLGGMPHERAVFSAPEGDASAGGGGGGAAPAAAPTTAPAGTTPGSSTPNAPPVAGAAGAPPPAAAPVKPTREPFKIKHKHKIADEGTEPRELELELDISEHLAGYKRKVKADGRELDVSLDEAFDTYPLNKGAQNRLREAHEIRTTAEKQIKQVERVTEMLKSPDDAEQLLRRSLGDEKFVEMAMKVVADRIQYEKMTPQQRAQHDADQKAAREQRARERNLREREGALTQRERQIQTENAKRRSDELVKEWTPVLASVNLPQTDASIREMATLIKQARDIGYQMSPQEAAREMRGRLDSLLGEVMKSGDPERVRALLGDQGAEQIRQLEVKRLEEQPGRVISTPQTQGNPPPPSGVRTREPQSLEELRREMRRENVEQEQRRFRG